MSARDESDPWMRHMRRGDFAAAWHVSDAVLQARAGVPCWRRPRHLQYVWDGTPLEGRRVLVRCYHGLGDTVQFIRYAPLVKRIAREVAVWAQPALLPLLETVEGIDRLLPLHDGTPEVDYDVDVEVMELPHVFRSTLATLPCATPYLHVEPARLDDLGGDAGAKCELNVGIVWRAGEWNERRSLTGEALAALARVRGVQWVILQQGARRADWPGENGITTGEHSVLDAARIMRALDLVITVDTLAAHLAGALAVPTWTLLPAEADWRWRDRCEDCAWYPTMQLFRQRRPGEWDEVVARVAGELEARVLVKRRRDFSFGVDGARK